MILSASCKSSSIRTFIVAALGVAVTTYGASASADPVAYLQSIGVNVTDNLAAQDRTAAQWTPSAAGVNYKIEDSVGSGGFVGPGYGGQAYDLEALYVQRTASSLIITGVSGANFAYNPAAGTASPNCVSPCEPTYGMGDFFIGSKSGNTFSPQVGIEVTGHHFIMNNTTGNTTGWSSPLNAGDVVSLTGSVNGNTLTGGSAGDRGWETGLSSWNGAGAPTQLAAGYTTNRNQTLATMTYGQIGTGPHYVYQATIDLTLFSLTAFQGVDLNSMVVRWGEICGNDILEVNPVPTPSTLSLMVGLMGLGYLVRRRRQA